MFDIIGKRNWFFAFSLAITIPGLIFILLGPITGGKQGLQFAIDFTGGTVWTIRFADSSVTPQQVKDVFTANAMEASVTSNVSASGSSFLEIRTREVTVAAPPATPAPTVAASPSASAGSAAASASAAPSGSAAPTASTGSKSSCARNAPGR